MPKPIADVGKVRQAAIPIGDGEMRASLYNTDAKNPPIVFIHGITASNSFWQPIQPEPLQSGWRWYALSLPGHYPARFPSNVTLKDINAAALGTVMADALSKLTNGEPAILVGHSTGGWAALNLAIHKPELVRGIVSVSGFAHGYWTGALRLPQMMASWGTFGRWLFEQYFRLGWRSKAAYIDAGRRLAADPSQKVPHPNYEMLIDLTYADSQHIDLRKIALWFAQMPQIDITPQLSQIQVPTLVIHGDADPIVPYTQGQTIAAQVPNAELVTLAGCGHMPMLERIEQYEQTLLSWLQKQTDL